MLISVPRLALTTTRRIVMSAPLRISETASASQLKSRLYATGSEVLRIERLVQPLDRDLVERSVAAHLGDRFVQDLLQARCVLVQRDMIGRGQKLELLLRLQGGLARQNLRSDIVADHHELGLSRQEGLDHGVVVVEALDVGIRRRRFGERAVLERAAIDGDALA